MRLYPLTRDRPRGSMASGVRAVPLVKMVARLAVMQEGSAHPHGPRLRFAFILFGFEALSTRIHKTNVFA